MDLNGQTFEVGELEKDKAHEYFDVFIRSGLHRKPDIVEWPKKRTECIFEYFSPSSSRDKKLYRVRNTSQHAEKLLLDDLKIMVKNKELLHGEIKVFINYSSCANCSKCIKDNNLDKLKPVKIKFVFAQLFDINRESCKEERCRAKLCLQEKHPHTRNNLRAVKDYVQPFNEDEWKVLQALLLKYSGWRDISEREDEDIWLQQDWKKVKENPRGLGLGELFEEMSIAEPSAGTPPSD